MLSKQLDRATTYADGAKFQTSKYSFRHGMRNGKQSPEEAKKMADEFVRERFKWARYEFDKGNKEKALFILGVALHAIQDATSPSHGGFQEWTGHENNWEKAGHLGGELFYPGPNSNLYKETYKFLDLFFSKQELPTGNIFDNIQIDKLNEENLGD
ncbi:hypothetical protein [Fluviicola sp.]|uniref:hypothetical protein n=1 Tax=Fluviicola sp. TaxID=1917219 RepID=UPI003D2D36FE